MIDFKLLFSLRETSLLSRSNSFKYSYGYLGRKRRLIRVWPFLTFTSLVEAFDLLSKYSLGEHKIYIEGAILKGETTAVATEKSQFELYFTSEILGLTVNEYYNIDNKLGDLLFWKLKIKKGASNPLTYSVKEKE